MKLPEAAGRGGEEGSLRAAGADLRLAGAALGVLCPVALGKRATLVIPPESSETDNWAPRSPGAAAPVE